MAKKQVKKSTKKRLTRVSVRAERHPEPDWDKFAYALLQYTRLLMAKQQRAKGRKGSP